MVEVAMGTQKEAQVEEGFSTPDRTNQTAFEDQTTQEATSSSKKDRNKTSKKNYLSLNKKVTTSESLPSLNSLSVSDMHRLSSAKKLQRI